MVQEQTKERSPRVALIASEETVLEYTAFLQHHLVGLTDESIPAALVCPHDWDRRSIFTATAEVIGYPVFNLPLMGPVNTRLLTEQLIRFKPTLIHCLCDSQAALARRLAHRLDIPYVLTVNSLRRGWTSLSVSSTHCVRIIVPAKSIAENVAGKQIRFTGRIEQINIGAFAEEAATCFTKPSQLATLITAHRFHKVDEYENLFGVVRHLLIDGYEFMMVVIGVGRADRQLWKLLGALGLLHIVTLVPRGMPWRSLLAAGDLFIRPQPRFDYDPQLLEAMSLGAAVAACQGGVDDLIIGDRTALVFDPNDELSILRTLKRLLDRRELSRQMGEANLNYVRANHSVSKMVSAMIRIYRGIQG